MSLPDALDLELTVATILEKHGNAALATPDPYWMKKQITAWSKRRKPIWEKLYNTTILEYNPIENYDRYETITDTTTTGRTTSGEAIGSNSESASRTGTGTDTETTNTTSETKHDVSAENASDYQADSKDTGTNGVKRDSSTSEEIKEERDISASSTTTGKEDIKETYEHTNRTHGNIGVTTSQQMLEAERKVVRYSLMEEIAEDYRDTFCLDIY